MSKYEILLFDADATLLDFKRSEREAVIESLTFFGIPATDEVIEKYSEINDGYWKMLERGEIEKSKLYDARWQSLIEFYGFDCDVKALSNKYIDALTTKSYELDGAVEICEKLYNSGNFRMYLVTNGQKQVQEGRLFPSPVFKFFDDCFISEDIGFEKPSIKYFDAVRKLIPDYDATKAIIIGDSLTSDIQGGINAGIDTCWFNPRGKQAPENMEITYIINELSELEEILL
jgi:2-haloacid dehalogenase